jgi:hypothetical protein
MLDEPGVPAADIVNRSTAIETRELFPTHLSFSFRGQAPIAPLIWVVFIHTSRMIDLGVQLGNLATKLSDLLISVGQGWRHHQQCEC